MFCMYIQYHASKELKNNVVIYALGVLYILSTATFVLDITSVVAEVSRPCIHNNRLSVYTGKVTIPSDPTESLLFRLEALSYTSNTITGLCDFISQGILVCIKNPPIHFFIYLNFQRSTDVGSYGVAISVS